MFRLEKLCPNRLEGEVEKRQHEAPTPAEVLTWFQTDSAQNRQKIINLRHSGQHKNENQVVKLWTIRFCLGRRRISLPDYHVLLRIASLHHLQPWDSTIKLHKKLQIQILQRIYFQQGITPWIFHGHTLKAQWQGLHRHLLYQDIWNAQFHYAGYIWCG